MTYAARITAPDTSERRDARRRELGRASTLRNDDGFPIGVVVRDLSTHGFAIETETDLAIGSTISLGLPGLGRVTGTVVRREATGYGCELVVPLSAQAVTNAFAASTVVAGRFPTLMAPPAGLRDPQIDKWPVAIRLLTMTSAAALLWTAIFAII